MSYSKGVTFLIYLFVFEFSYKLAGRVVIVNLKGENTGYHNFGTYTAAAKTTVGRDTMKGIEHLLAMV